MSILSNIKTKVQTYFFSAGRTFGNSSAGGVTSANSITSNLANFLIDMSNFTSLREEEVYEQMYVWEPEIAAAVIKISDMCRGSFEYFTAIDESVLENIPDNYTVAISSMAYSSELPIVEEEEQGLLVTNSSDLIDEMVDTANLIARKIGVKECFEIWSSVMYTQGFIALEKNEDLSLSVLPNDRITFVDDPALIGTAPTTMNYLMTQANYLVIDELQVTQRVLSKEQFVVIKINNTPVHVKDRFGRKTFGIYPVSPLQRALVPVWMSRQIKIIEVMWRWGNIPREHHKIAAEAFNLNLYPGTPEQKRVAAEKDLNRFINAYSAQLQMKVPDQMYVTSDNVTIENIEHTSNTYMGSNEFLESINKSIWLSLNIPKSFVSGETDNSYASETIMSSVTGMRIKQMSEKIAEVVTDNMRERLLLINPSYPVEYLEARLSFDVSESKLEKAKRAQLLGTMGIYTPNELREINDDAPLTEQQMEDEGVVCTIGTPCIFTKSDMDKLMKQKTDPMAFGSDKQMPGGSKTTGFASVRGPSTGGPKYPTTPKSSLKQPTSSADAVNRKPTKSTE